MDYARQARLKVFGQARITDVRRAATGAVSERVRRYRARVEREVRIEVSAYDWNCPQHITARYSVEELAPVLAPLHQRIADLEAENAQLRMAPLPSQRPLGPRLRDGAPARSGPGSQDESKTASG